MTVEKKKEESRWQL